MADAALAVPAMAASEQDALRRVLDAQGVPEELVTMSPATGESRVDYLARVRTAVGAWMTSRLAGIPTDAVPDYLRGTRLQIDEQLATLEPRTRLRVDEQLAFSSRRPR
jgi:hypothetical protein